MSVARAALIGLLGWAALCTLIPATARPEGHPDSEGRALHLRAEQHYRGGDYAAALALYQRAYRVTGLPGFLFNMAQSLRRMQHWRAALTTYRQFAVQVPEAANRDDVRELIRRCEARVLHDRSASRRPPPSPQARVDTTRPLPHLSIVPGMATVEPRGAPGRAALLWTGSALAGALLVSGTVTGILALQASDEYQRPNVSVQRSAELSEQGRAYRTASTVSFAVAGSLAVSTALVYWLYRPRAPQRISVALLPGGASFAVGQSF